MDLEAVRAYETDLFFVPGQIQNWIQSPLEKDVRPTQPACFLEFPRKGFSVKHVRFRMIRRPEKSAEPAA